MSSNPSPCNRTVMDTRKVALGVKMALGRLPHSGAWDTAATVPQTENFAGEPAFGPEVDGKWKTLLIATCLRK